MAKGAREAELVSRFPTTPEGGGSPKTLRGRRSLGRRGGLDAIRGPFHSTLGGGGEKPSRVQVLSSSHQCQPIILLDSSQFYCVNASFGGKEEPFKL